MCSRIEEANQLMALGREHQVTARTSGHSKEAGGRWGSREKKFRIAILFSSMATADSWKSIEKHGMLSTEELLKLFEVDHETAEKIRTTHRPGPVVIEHTKHGTATIRDQEPLSQKKLEKCLIDCDAPTWYRTLNERVFFWLSEGRLKTLMSAKEYVDETHTVLRLDTARLVARYEGSIELAHMNTGNTLPFAHPRGRSTFRTMAAYPYDERQRLTDYSAVVELTVMRGVPDLREYDSCRACDDFQWRV
jgi:hypothetical protein